MVRSLDFIPIVLGRHQRALNRQGTSYDLRSKRNIWVTGLKMECTGQPQRGMTWLGKVKQSYEGRKNVKIVSFKLY